MTAYAGFGRVVGVSYLPDRAQPALYEEIDGEVTPLAYFKSGEAADQFNQWLSRVVERANSVHNNVRASNSFMSRDEPFVPAEEEESTDG